MTCYQGPLIPYSCHHCEESPMFSLPCLSLQFLKVFFLSNGFISLIPIRLQCRFSKEIKEPELKIFEWIYSFQQRRQWHPTPVLLPGKFHGWKSLVGCSPWGRQELDTTERLHFDFLLSCIGEGNGNPLQCSCLENSMDGKAWQSIVHGVEKIRT